MSKRIKECKCQSLKEKVLGDGCDECNPEMAIEVLEDNIYCGLGFVVTGDPKELIQEYKSLIKQQTRDEIRDRLDWTKVAEIGSNSVLISIKDRKFLKFDANHFCIMMRELLFGKVDQ